MLEPSILPKLAYDALAKAENCKEKHGKVSDEILFELHSFFGEPLQDAVELLNSCKLTKYQIPDTSRCFFKIGDSKQQYTVHKDINYCQCQFFKHQVLQLRNHLTCRHVLAVKLNQGNCRVELVTDLQFVEFLNEQLNYDL